MLMILSSNTSFKMPDAFNNKKHNYKSFVSKLKSHEKTRLEKFNKVFTTVTDHGKDEFQGVLKFHQDMFKELKNPEQTTTDTNDYDTMTETTPVEPEVVDEDFEELEDSQFDNDEYFEK